MKTSKTDLRKRSWAFILYPESAPENWLQILENERINAIISPLHDKDIDELSTENLENSSGEIIYKKPHHHILLSFEGKKSPAQIKEITDKFNSPAPMPVNSYIGQVRYFTHIDNPDKAQYNKADIKTFGNIDIEKVFNTAHDKKQISKDILHYVMENEITEYFILIKYALENNDDWYDYLSSNSFMVMNFIKSLRHSKQEEAYNTNK